VVNVAHYYNNGASFNKVFILIVKILNKSFLNGDNYFLLDLCTKFFGNKRGSVKIHRLVYSCHNAKSHEFFNDFIDIYFKAAGKFRHHDFIRNKHFQLLLSCTFKLKPAEFFRFGLMFCRILLFVLLGGFLRDFLLFGIVVLSALGVFKVEVGVFFIILIQIDIISSCINSADIFLNICRICKAYVKLRFYPMLVRLWRLLFLFRLFMRRLRSRLWSLSRRGSLLLRSRIWSLHRRSGLLLRLLWSLRRRSSLLLRSRLWRLCRLCGFRFWACRVLLWLLSRSIFCLCTLCGSMMLCRLPAFGIRLFLMVNRRFLFRLFLSCFFFFLLFRLHVFLLRPFSFFSLCFLFRLFCGGKILIKAFHLILLCKAFKDEIYFLSIN